MESKRWFQSKSLWACFVMLVSATLSFLAHPAVGFVSPEIAVAANQWLTSVAVGLGVAGRLTAKTTIK